MQSSRSDFLGILETMRREQEQRARDLGFASVDAMVHAEESEARRREAHEIELTHRREVVHALGARITDEVAAALASGTERDTDATRIVREWAETSKPVLVLSGGVGTGKTVAALSYVCRRPGAWQFVRAARLGSMFERWTSDREDRVEALRLSIPTMIVDDLGQEPIDDRRTIPALHELLDSRKSARTRTIITTNLSLDDARKRYPAPDVSRLAESATWVLVGGDDMRRSR